MRTYLFACLAVALASLALPAPAAMIIDPGRSDQLATPVAGKSSLTAIATTTAIGTDLMLASRAQSALGDRPADGTMGFTNVENGCAISHDAIGDATVDGFT